MEQIGPEVAAHPVPEPGLDQAANEAFPLSVDQQPLWFLDQLRGGNPADHLSCAWRLEGPLDLVPLENALDALLERHAALRMVFESTPAEVVQRVRPNVRLPLERNDLQTLPPGQRMVEVADVLARQVRLPFALDQGPPVRATLLQLGEGDWILLIVLHHLVADAHSLEVIARDLSRLYAAYVNGSAHDLPPLERRYAGFVSDRQRTLDQTDLAAARTFWQERLDGYNQVVELPLDRPRPSIQSANGARTFFTLAPDRTGRLRQIAKAAGTSFAVVLLSLLFVLLKRHTAQTRIALGTPLSLRKRAAFDDLVGMFLAMTVVDVDMADEPTLGELIGRVAERFAAAGEHNLPFQELVRAVDAGRDLSRNPVFQVMAQLSTEAVLELPEITATAFDFDPGTSQFDLSFHFLERKGELHGFIEFDSECYDARSIEALRDRLLCLLDIDRPDLEQRISTLEVMPSEERERVLQTWNRTERGYPEDQTLSRLFERQVEATPERPAVRSGPTELSYRQLNARANRLAQHLRTRGLQPGVFAGICMRRSADMIVSVLAVLKAGGAYLPLDPSFPRERLDFVIEDSGAALVITDLGAAAPFERAGRTVVDLDASSAPDDPDETNPDIPVSSRELAYLIYTSGSTGRPKGVQIEHRSVVNFLDAMRREPGLAADDRLLAVTTLSFDISVLEMFLPLTTGAFLIVADQETTSDGELLKGLLTASRATIMQATPSTWRMLVDSGWRDEVGIKKLAGGEAMPAALADELAAMPGSLWNMYGPTETTIWSSVRRLHAGQEVRIGGPIANTQFYVVGPELVPVPEGVPGELLIGGDGVARGYWLRDELTAERFIDDPFTGRAGARLYRTGDLVRLRPDGSLSFLGRIDRQVKVRGFRIELGDIEQTIIATGMVKDALVVTRDDGSGNTILVAYYVERPGEAADFDALRRDMRAKLPHYMVPSAFVALEAWPLTPNGKVDHKRLPAPERKRSGGVAITTPAGRAERTVRDVWQKLLQLGEVGLDENFFDLGGHSLLLARMREELARHFERRLTLPDLFRLPTVRLLASELGPQAAGIAASEDPEPARRSATRGARPPAAGRSGEDRRDAERIAIIGMSGRFPGARNVAELWENLTNGVESIRRFGDDELLANGVPDDILSDPRYVKAGTVLDDVEMFDAGFFGMSPREAMLTEPQQRLFLEAAWAALEDAGYAGDDGPLAAGVFAGVGQNGYVHGLGTAPAGDYALDQLKAIGNEKDYLASRVAYHLNLKGPALVVQATCATSLVAVHLACQNLLAHECDLALAGGVSVMLPQGRGYLHHEGGLLSPDGHCRPFDARAGGYVPGRGLGVVVLKRLSEALEDGDRVDAVIRASAVNNDGAMKVGFAALSVEGQAEVVGAALALADVPPETIHYMEAFGSGTPFGDPIEVEALDRAFRSHCDAVGFCRIGSIKSNIGHPDVAAGVAGLIKAALVVKTGLVPPSLHFETPNPEIDFARTPFVVADELTRLERGAAPLRAGVSAFGIGGTNAHVILEEPPVTADPRPLEGADAPALILVSAKTPTALDEASGRLADHLDAEAVDLADVAWTLQVGRRHFSHRRVVVAHDAATAAAKLRDAAGSPSSVVGAVPEVVFVLAGGPVTDPSPIRDLYEGDPGFRARFDHCLASLGLEPESEALTRAVGQPWTRGFVVFALEHALAETWIGRGIGPAALLGAGSGLLVAASLAGMISFEDALLMLAGPDGHEALADIVLQPPTVPVLAAATGRAIDAGTSAKALFAMLRDGAERRFEDALAAVLEAPNRVVLEIGAAETIAPHVRSCASAMGLEPDIVLTSLPLSGQSVDAACHAQEVLGQLWLAGLRPDFRALHPKSRRRVGLPTYPFARVAHWHGATSEPAGRAQPQVAPGDEVAEGEGAPGNETERALATIFADVLGAGAVRADDDFFHLGGDSLLALSVAGRARALGLSVSPQQIASTPTVAGLAATALSSRASSAPDGCQAVGPLPLTPFLARFLRERGERDPHRWNLSTIVRCRHRLDPRVLERALTSLVERHDSLRLRVVRQASTWVTDVVPGPVGRFAFEVVDLASLADDEVRAAIEARSEAAQRALHLGDGPIMRMVLFDLGPARLQRLLAVVHHFAVDGFAWMVLFDHLEHIYLALERDQEPAAPPRFGMKAWADDLARFARDPARRAEVAAWKTLPWSDARTLRQDHPADAALNTNASAAAVARTLEADETARLLRSAGRGVSAETVMIAALGRALARFQGDRHVFFERLFQGRNVTGSPLDLSASLGSFLCYAPCLLEVDPELGAPQVVRAVDEQMRDVAGQGAVIDLVRYMAPAQSDLEALSDLPRAQVLFNYRGRVDGMFERSDLFTRADESAGSDYDPAGLRYYPLAVRADVAGGRLELTIVYSRNLHDSATVECLADDIMSFIRKVIDDPDG